MKNFEPTSPTSPSALIRLICFSLSCFLFFTFVLFFSLLFLFFNRDVVAVAVAVETIVENVRLVSPGSTVLFVVAHSKGERVVRTAVRTGMGSRAGGNVATCVWMLYVSWTFRVETFSKRIVQRFGPFESTTGLGTGLGTDMFKCKGHLSNGSI